MALKKYHVSKNLLNPATLENNLNLDTTTGLPVAFSSRVATATPIDISSINSVTLTYTSEISTTRWLYSILDDNDTKIARVTGKNSGSSIDTSNGTKLYICFYNDAGSEYGGITTDILSNIMLNTGSTALPYEPYGNTWNDIPYRRYETATDTVTSLPVTLYTDGHPVSSYTLKGNTETSGTPSPSNPITISGCGDKTANLYDKTAHNTNNGFDDTGYLDSNGNVVDSYSYQVTEYIAVEAEQAYTLVYGTGARYSPSVCFYDSAKNFISGMKYNDVLPRVFTTPQNTAYLRFSIGDTAIDAGMLNIGSTALPYEPFGYKISISSNQTALTPMYLTQQLYGLTGHEDNINSSGTITYNIKQLVLTGQETWYTSGNIYYTKVTDGYNQHDTPSNLALCTHFDIRIDASTESGTFNLGGLTQNVSSTWNGNIVFNKSGYATLQDFQDFLAAQYSNGTPVTMYYVLKNPTTESVTAPSIPTTGGEVSIDVDTTVKPSELDLTYHGWHEHEPLKRENGQWS